MFGKGFGAQQHWGYPYGPEIIFRRHGGLKYYILWLLSQKPMKGSEIMDEIEKQSYGTWKPSPGSIYPRLDMLAEEGLIVKNEDNKYSITKKGKEYIGLSDYTNAIGNIESSINEVSGLIDYLEDHKEELQPYKDKLNKIKEKLNKLLS
jgi:DNA-binding PadR family transcriptional regulator